MQVTVFERRSRVPLQLGTWIDSRLFAADEVHSPLEWTDHPVLIPFCKFGFPSVEEASEHRGGEYYRCRRLSRGLKMRSGLK